MASKPQFVGERVPLNRLCTKGKSSLRQKDVVNDGPYCVYGASGIVGSMATFQNERPYVAVVKDGAGVGRVSLCAEKTSVLGTMQSLIPNEGVLAEYLLHLIRSMRLGEGFSGSTIPHIYFKDYGKCEVRVFSLEGQKQIVERLSVIESFINKLERLIEKTDLLVKSRFVEMFGTAAEPKHPVVELESVCSAIVDCPHETPKYEGELVYPAIRTSELQNAAIEWSTMRYVSAEEYQKRIKRLRPLPGDLVYSSDGTYGEAVMLPPGFEFCLGQRTMLFRANKEMCIPEYLLHSIVSADVKRQADELNVGSTVPHVNVRDAKRFKIMLPSKTDQQEFADFVAHVDKPRFVAHGGSYLVQENRHLPRGSSVSPSFSKACFMS